MQRKLFCILLIMVSVTAFLLLPSIGDEPHSVGASGTHNEPQRDFEIIDLLSSDHGLSFRLIGGDIGIDSEGQLKAEGLNGSTQEPGAPSLPFYSTFIVLPPGAGVELSMSQPNWIDTGHFELSREMKYEFPGATLDDDIVFPPVDESSLIDREEITAFNRDAYHPQNLYDLSEPMYVRDIRLVKLSIYPIRYNPIQQTAMSAGDITVRVDFTDTGSSSSKAIPSYGDNHSKAISEMVLNWDQGKDWRSVPDEGQSQPQPLPIGVDVFKIAVNSDNIFKIGYSELQAAGMDVDNVNPNSFEMLHRGESVSYRFGGNDDAKFEEGEELLFYGWMFDGPRLEKQFVTDNIFWLWAAGSPSYVEEIESVSGTPVDSFLSTVTREPENVWFPTWTDRWDEFPNEPDAWYWERYTKLTATPLTRTYEITLPNPVEAGQIAILTAELSSKYSPSPDGNPTPHVVHVSINDGDSGTTQWYGKRNVNVTTTIPITGINDGINQVKVVIATASSIGSGTAVYLNRLTVDYQRELVADNDQLSFMSSISGTKEFSVNGFNTGTSSDIYIWDISDKYSPRHVLSNSVIISGSGPYSYTFGSDSSAGAEFFATTYVKIETPSVIERLVLEDIEARPSGADWIAITHIDFITEVDRLANHRSSPYFGSLKTHVVDVDSIINQYGYGLPMPSAIRGYLVHAMNTWDVPPSYVTLIGDATINPRNNLNSGKQFYAPQLVPTDLAFVDRFQGQIPSDHVYSTLIGRDLLPDIAVGRIPVTNTEQVRVVVDKIVTYEHNQLLPSSWMENILFMADAIDASAGNFCRENQITSTHLPDVYSIIELCVPESGDVKQQFFDHTEDGVSIVNYRGHGSPDSWGKPTILDTSNTGEWRNRSKPVIILTGDCLDGFFAIPSWESLAETFLRANNGGSAAHWSSSGLGYSIEHSRMVEGFYDGLYLAGQTAVGDAANYAKLEYFFDGGHDSLMYSFILEGDPAMQVMRPALSLNKSTTTTSARPSEIVEFQLEVANYGIYPSHILITDTLPVGMSFITATSSIQSEIHTVGNDVVFDLQFGEADRNKGLPWNATASITITAEVDNSASGGLFTNVALVDGTGMEAWPGDETDSASFFVWLEIVLPLLTK